MEQDARSVAAVFRCGCSIAGPGVISLMRMVALLFGADVIAISYRIVIDNQLAKWLTKDYKNNKKAHIRDHERRECDV